MQAETPGKDTRAILEGLVSGELDALLVFGADLMSDFPDAGLARRALEASPFTAVIELFPTDTVRYADVALPSVAYAERQGTFTNLERRIQKLEPLRNAPGSARVPWQVCADLARALGHDWGWTSFDDVWADINKIVPTHAAVDVAALAQKTPAAVLNYESPYETHVGPTVAGPGAGYPKGHRSGSPFQTGYSWPLSWELRAFEAKQRPGVIPPAPEAKPDTAVASEEDASRVPEQDGGLVLLSGRMIYDQGAMVARTRALRGIARKPFLEMSAADASRLGVAEGERVVVAANGAEAELPVVVGDIAEGAVFVPYHQEGLQANALMGAGPRVQVRKR